MKKYLLLLLFLLMFSQAGWPAVGDKFVVTLESGDNMQFTIISDTECGVSGLPYINNVVIPPNVTYDGITYSVVTIEDHVSYGYRVDLLSISLPSSITYIGNSAFSGCSTLTTVVIPENSCLETIGEEAFTGCVNLTNITLPASLSTIGTSAFSGSGIKTVTIPANVVSIGEFAFDSCLELTSVSFSEGCQITDIGGWFAGCEKLTSISLPEGIESIGEAAFSGCTKLSTVSLPSSLLTIGEFAFQECANLSKISIPENVTTIGESAFGLCTNLQSISLPESLETIGSYAFEGCFKLTAITIPDKVERIEDGTFYGCTSLTTLHIGKGLSEISSSAFSHCDLATITVDDANETFYSPSGSNAVIERSELSIILGCKSTIIPFGVKYISIGAFGGCLGLTTIAIPETVEFISNQAFSGCSNLSSITLPTSLRWIGREAFYGCESLTAINIPQNVYTIEIRAFSGCKSLATITVDGNNATYDSRNGCNAIIESSSNKLIAGCNGTIIPDGVTSIGTAAFEGSGIVSLIIPKSVTEIAAYNPFRSCADLESIIVDSENSAYDSRDNCNAIIETSTNSLIAGCKTTVIPDDVAIIKENAFWEFGGFETITIPESVIGIESGAIHRCYDLKTVVLKSSNPPDCSPNNFNNDSFYWDNLLNLTIPTFYVPAGSKTDYINADGWRSFKNYIVEMEPEVQSFSIPVAEGKEWVTYYQEENDYTVSEGIEVYVVSDVDVEVGTVTINAVNGIPKEVPVLLRSTNEGGFTSEDKMTAVSTAIDVDVTPSDYYKGVTTATDISGEGLVYVLIGSKFVKADASAGANTTLAANRCYISIPEANGARMMNIVIDNDATGIKAVDAVEKNSDEKWYDLQGRSVCHPVKKGVYVKNGKKVVIR